MSMWEGYGGGSSAATTTKHSTSSSPSASRATNNQSPQLLHSASLTEMNQALEPAGGGGGDNGGRSPSPFDFAGNEMELLDGQSETNCPYCHRTYRQPRLLRCLHALCEDCIIAQLERRPDDLALINTRRFGYQGGRFGQSRQQMQQQQQSDLLQEREREMLVAAKSNTPKSDLLDELEPSHAREHKPPPGVIRCPVCKQDSQVGNDIRFVSNLLIDYVTLNMLDTNAVHSAVVLCESCKGKEQAIARCQDCNKMICKNCVQAHQYMKCFDGHVVINFDEMKPKVSSSSDGGGGRLSSLGGGGTEPSALIHRPINCGQHANEPYKYACASCSVLICNECVVSDHRPSDSHQLHKIDNNTDQALRDELKKLLGIADVKVQTINESHCNLEDRLDGLKTQVELGREAVQNAFDRFAEILEEHRQKMLVELEDLYARDERDMNDRFKTVANTTEKVNDAVRFAQRLLTYGNSVEMLQSRQTVTDQLLQLLRSLPNNAPAPNLQYQCDEGQFKNALYGACGYFKNEVFSSAPPGPQPVAPVRPGMQPTQAQQQDNPAGVLKPCIYSTGAPLNPLDLPKQYQQIIQQVMQHQHHSAQPTSVASSLQQHHSSSGSGGNAQPPPMATVPPSLNTHNSITASQHAPMPPPPGLIGPVGTGAGGPHMPAAAPGFPAGLAGLGGPLHQWNAQQQLQMMELAQQIQAAGGGPAGAAPNLQALHALLSQQQRPLSGVSQPTPLLATVNRQSVDSAFNSRSLTGSGLPSTPLSNTSSASLFDAISSQQQRLMQQGMQSRPVTSLGRPLAAGANTATVNASGLAGLLDQRNAFGLPVASQAAAAASLVGTMPSPMASQQQPFPLGMGMGMPHQQQQVKPFTSTSPTTSIHQQRQQQPPMQFQPISTPPIELLANAHLSDGGSKDQSPPSDMSAASNVPVRHTSSMQQMQIRNRFGTLGPGHGQFNSPHGFCLGFDDEIVVADTNNHRVQIFNKTAQFLKQFGMAGKEDGQMWYPRKVAVLNRGDSQFYIVCDRGSERSRMQIFTREGVFHKKIAIRYVDIVAGLAVDSNDNVIAVDSVSPTVFKIGIDNGELIKWFDCSEYMKEPSDIAVSASNEYYICDFKGHCVCVFSEEGKFLRKIGSMEVTSFPNGIDISDAGDVLIGDSHGNRFHVAIYKRTGEFETEFECPSIKVSRCCGLRITSEGLIVTLAKNNHYALILNTLYVT